MTIMTMTIHIYHGLLNTRPYMSHLKAKIKTSVFQKNSTKWRQRFQLNCQRLMYVQFTSCVYGDIYFVDLQHTTLPKTSSSKVFFQGFFLLFYFSLGTPTFRNTFEWLLPNFCFTRLFDTNKKKSIN